MNVCFTGPAVGLDGNVILRADLVLACKAKGINVHPSVMASTDLLVASRKDTCKAKAALLRGVFVWTYQEFLSAHFPDPIPQNAKHHNSFVDAPLHEQMPDFTAEHGLEEADLL